LAINGLKREKIIQKSVRELKEAWQKPFGDLI